MNTFSPVSKISKLMPLNHLKKAILNDEEPMFLEGNSKEIKFNDLLIVLNYHPEKEVTQIKRQVLKCQGLSNIGWMNPCLDQENAQNISNKKSILKRTDNRRLQ
ncbi:unnamed protein product [Paramecium sonneborni]|uniref:Uncharacterized protein n=1 Tax=Paramecium sonneborni TaxID=65129 RepID=A0A8S1K6D3_9CILI|nr:unnamed protein product [Paramecium sonneborni]